LLLNLIGNAVEACADQTGEPRILIETAVTETACAITIIDPGPGMTEETLLRAFDPFYSTRPGAIGLGLTIGRSIVEAHGGTIAITAPQGRGETRVRVALPRLTQG
jgi:signal transduction histidine kinase